MAVILLLMPYFLDWATYSSNSKRVKLEDGVSSEALPCLIRSNNSDSSILRCLVLRLVKFCIIDFVSSIISLPASISLSSEIRLLTESEPSNEISKSNKSDIQSTLCCHNGCALDIMERAFFGSPSIIE